MVFGPVPNLPTGEPLVDASRVFHGNINGGTNLDSGQSVRVHFAQHALYVPDTTPPQIIPIGAHTNMTCASRIPSSAVTQPRPPVFNSRG